MKAQNNTQKTVRNQVSKMVLVGSAVIFSLVLICWAVKAQNLQEQFLPTYNYGKMAMYINDQPSESKKADAANHEINAKVSTRKNTSTSNFVSEPEVEAISTLQVEEYNAKKFVDDEMDHEIESWKNSAVETTNEAESALQVDEYNAKKFVDAEMDHEIENWKINTVENLNKDIPTESAFQVEEYNANEFADAEVKQEIENWMINERPINEAEAITVKEVDVEIEKYAQEVIHIQENQSGYTDKMTDENFIKSAEKETAMEAEQQIEKYASRQIFQQQDKAGTLIAGNEK